MSGNGGAGEDSVESSSYGYGVDKKTLVAMGVGSVVAIAAAPVVISSLGFGALGPTVGSIATKLMSAAALANGGGVAAGSTVSVLQSIGMAGMGATSTAVTGSVGAVSGMAVRSTASLVAGAGREEETGSEMTVQSSGDDGNRVTSGIMPVCWAAGAMGWKVATKVAGTASEAGVMGWNAATKVAGMASEAGVMGWNAATKVAGTASEAGVMGWNTATKVAGTASEAGVLASRSASWLLPRVYSTGANSITDADKDE